MEDSIFEIGAFMDANRAWMKSFAWGGLDVRPKQRLAVLTCMDSRYTAQGILGLELGDAHVIRNAGGRVTDDAIYTMVKDATGADASGIDFLPFTDLEGSVREDMRQLAECNLLPEDYQVLGFTYDVDTGLLVEVKLDS